MTLLRIKTITIAKTIVNKIAKDDKIKEALYLIVDSTK